MFKELHTRYNQKREPFDGVHAYLLPGISDAQEFTELGKHLLAQLEQLGGSGDSFAYLEWHWHGGPDCPTPDSQGLAAIVEALGTGSDMLGWIENEDDGTGLGIVDSSYSWYCFMSLDREIEPYEYFLRIYVKRELGGKFTELVKMDSRLGNLKLDN